MNTPQNLTTVGMGDRSTTAQLRKLAADGSMVIVFVALLLAMTVLRSDFLTVDNVTLIFLQASVRAILAIGMMLVIVSGGIDISVGTTMSLSMVVMAVAVIDGGLPLGLGFVLAIAVGALVGVMNGLLIAYARLPAFIVTLGMLGIAQGLALLVSNGRSLYGFPDSFEFVGGGSVLGIPVPVLLMLGFMGFMLFVFRQTRIGRYAYTLGGNEEATRRAGIDVSRLKLAIYAASGATAGLASIVLAARINSAHPAAGMGYELDAIAAVVIGGGSLMGGRGTVWGAVVGALLMSEIRFALNILGMSPFIQQIVVGAILIAAVWLDQIRNRRLGKHK